MIFGALFIVVLYGLLIASLALGFGLVKPFRDSNFRTLTRFSIIVPFRNEVENLPALIKSLENLDYSNDHFEIIFVNDDSQDNSVELSLRLLSCSQLDFKIIDNHRTSNSPKKDAITKAIQHAKYDWIITTDADCKVPKKWLDTCNSYINNNDVLMVAAPVTFTFSNSWFTQFQMLDLLSLQGATIGGFGLKSPFLCNGANLLYRKEVFTSLNGFESNNKIASGDDIFMLEKALKKFPKKVGYLKSEKAIVYTDAEASLSALIQQRIRWAAKSSAYSNTFGKLVGLLVLLMNVLIVATLILSVLGLFKWLYFVTILALKLAVDYLLLYKSAKFFNQSKALNVYFFSGLIYPFFSVFVIYKALFFNYKWKGRSFKK